MTPEQIKAKYDETFPESRNILTPSEYRGVVTVYAVGYQQAVVDAENKKASAIQNLRALLERQA